MRWTRSALGAAAPIFLCGAVWLAAHDASAGMDDLVGTKPGDTFAPFIDADACSNCHGNGVDGDKSFLPADTWAGTMMANAARDPVFLAALTVTNQERPGAGLFCLRCHSPIGFVRGHAAPPDGSAFDAVDNQGIGCETCHRATASTLTPNPYVVSNAQLFYDDLAAKRGPFAWCGAPDPPADCAQSPGHDVVVEPRLASSSFCGQCHQVTNPERLLKDAAGVDTPFEFPLDTTYVEWEQSSFASGATARSCQDCHMVRTPGEHPVASNPGAPFREEPRAHAFVGGNLWGIRAVMAAYPERVAMHPDAFQLAQDRTLESLAQSVAVTLAGAPAAGEAGDRFEVTVKVENLTGHKFPTGYAESRRAWIAIVLTGSGVDRFLIGGYDAETGEIVDATSTHVYRAVHGRWNGTAGEPDLHLVQHDMVIEDTRIPPAGFRPTETTKIVGALSYTDGEGNVVNFDETTFRVTLPAGVYGTATLSARVYYQSMTREYVEFLAHTNTTDMRGHDLEAVYNATGRAPPIRIASADATIEFPPMSGGDEGGGCSVVDDRGGGVATGALVLCVAWLGRARRRRSGSRVDERTSRGGGADPSPDRPNRRGGGPSVTDSWASRR